jgi:hypothetical protein
MLFLYPGITVGLVRTYYSTPEVGGPLSVCVEMFDGNLARNVSLTLATSDGTAIGRTCRHAYIILNMALYHDRKLQHKANQHTSYYNLIF